MLFSSALFLYLFLPICLLFYYLLRGVVYRNAWLLICSLFFFAWGGVSYSILLLVSISLNYVSGLLIDKHLGTKKAWFFLALGVSINLLFLATFKYANFVIENLNQLFGFLQLPPVKNPGIMLPVGISFYTFHSLSYLVDIYRRVAKVQKNPVDLTLYISFFPQLIAGPIVRYHDICDQLRGRKESIDKVISGIERFVLGLGKKVLLANNFGLIADEIFALSPGSFHAPVAWLGIVSYTLQIYFDFSGYSDMAIGLARMFGFNFLENFNFPYMAKSIKEFWRRWHISLSNWFRDYLYISIGGNRFGVSRTYLNLAIVFLLTGFWHGASWTFLAWGAFHGFFLIIERIGFDKLLARLWSPIQVVYTLFFVMIGWILFRAETFGYAFDYVKALFSFGYTTKDYYIISNYLTTDYYWAFIFGLLGALGFFPFALNFIKEKTCHWGSILIYLRTSYSIATSLVLILILALSTLYLIAGTYNPFIYYRF